MSPDGVAATIIEKSFRKMAANENLQYKVSRRLNYCQLKECANTIYYYKFFMLKHSIFPTGVNVILTNLPRENL
jgi:hypothetical protein